MMPQFQNNPSITCGTLLISTPKMDDDFFKKSVIVVCDTSMAGSFGVAINKTIEDINFPTPVFEEDVIFSQIPLRAGGNIHPDHMMLLHDYKGYSDRTLPLTDAISIGGDLLYLEDMMKEEPLPFILICFGYCAWSAAQIDAEIDEGLWIIGPNIEIDHLKMAHDELWQHLFNKSQKGSTFLHKLPKNLKDN